MVLQCTSDVTLREKFVRDNYWLFLWFDFGIFHIIMCIIKENCTGVCGTTPVDTQVVGDDMWHHQKFLSKSCISSVDSKSKIGDISPSIRSWEKFLGSISTLGNHTSTMRRKLVRFETSRPLFDTIFVPEVPVTDQKSVFARGSWTMIYSKKMIFWHRILIVTT